MTRSRAAKAASSKTSAPSSRPRRAGGKGSARRKPAAAATIPALVEAQAKAEPGAVALLAPGREPLSYGALAEQMAETAAALRRLRIKKTDRVAIVLADACDAATAFLAVAGAAVAAPLNPQYLESEFESYFAALEPRALITGEDNDAARAAARKKKIPVLTLAPSKTAGAFTLEAPQPRGGRAVKLAAAKPGDTALLLFTSGTTAAPKLVPLTHANLTASANAVAETLRLTPADRGLAVMPLFHIHGLVAALLAPLSTGGSIAVPPGFHPIEFFAWLKAFKPSWFTAVPSMFQAILSRAAGHRGALAGAELRFIRSSSAPLPANVLAALEETFAAPVIESYGMTEAAHQMTSNPLPPAPRKAGTVGPAAGPEVAILGEKGKFLPAGEEGEVAVRGASVTKGYLGGAKANRAVFFKGWFRTGDLGVIDGDGYLRLAARIKEIINRGGEKIAPREVEEALMAHEAVAEAAVFPVPDPLLGEDVGAAVVLKPGSRAAAADLKSFAAGRLAHFKLPRHLAIVPAIPKSATGKVRRAALAGLLEPGREAAAGKGDATAPRNDLEAALVQFWREVLKVKEVGIHAPFLALGGDSILAAQLVSRIRGKLGFDLTMADIWDTPTVAAQAARLAGRARARGAARAKIPKRGEDVLSFSQEWWQWLESLSGNRAASNRGSSVLLRGPLDTRALARALGAVVERHESLRTTFAGPPGRRRPIVNAPVKVAISHTDLSALPIKEALERAHRMSREAARRPLPLDKYPLWRAGILRLAKDAHVLLFVVDHSLFDGWSMAVFVRDLAAFYEAIVKKAPPRLPPLAVQYGDIAAWQRARLSGERLAALENYWKRKLEGRPRPPHLPFAKKHPGRPSLRGGAIAARILPAVAESLRGLARAEGATLFMAAVAVFHALIARYTGAGDVLTGALTAGRGHIAAENLIGLFFNVLPLRGDLSGDPSPRALVARSRALVVEAFAHEEMPVQKIAALAGAKPGPGESPVPLVPILFQMRNFPAAKAQAAGVAFSEFKTPSEWATFDLTFDLSEEADGIACDLAYNAEAYDGKDVKRMLTDFARLAAAFAAAPDTPLSRIEATLEAEGGPA